MKRKGVVPLVADGRPSQSVNQAETEHDGDRHDRGIAQSGEAIITQWKVMCPWLADDKPSIPLSTTSGRVSLWIRHDMIEYRRMAMSALVPYLLMHAAEGRSPDDT